MKFGAVGGAGCGALGDLGAAGGAAGETVGAGLGNGDAGHGVRSFVWAVRGEGVGLPCRAFNMSISVVGVSSNHNHQRKRKNPRRILSGTGSR
ncbi:hypothetical protein GCM10009603_36030 [Nocardiopsis exhalans]